MDMQKTNKQTQDPRVDDSVVNGLMDTCDSYMRGDTPEDAVIDTMFSKTVQNTFYEMEKTREDDEGVDKDAVYKALVLTSLNNVAFNKQDSFVSPEQLFEIERRLDDMTNDIDDPYDKIFDGVEKVWDMPVDSLAEAYRNIEEPKSTPDMTYTEYQYEQLSTHDDKAMLREISDAHSDIPTLEEAIAERERANPEEFSADDYKLMGLNNDMFSIEGRLEDNVKKPTPLTSTELEDAISIDKDAIDKSVDNFRQFDADAKARKQADPKTDGVEVDDLDVEDDWVLE